MEDESLVWTSKDVVIVLQHDKEKIPLRYDFWGCYLTLFLPHYLKSALHLVVEVWGKPICIVDCSDRYSVLWESGKGNFSKRKTIQTKCRVTSIFLLVSYVSETKKQHAFPSMSQRHILAGLASTLGGLSAPYERASHIHERPIVNWLWAAGCHPFGPFSNSSQISQMLQDVALVWPILLLYFSCFWSYCTVVPKILLHCFWKSIHILCPVLVLDV